MAAKSKTKDPRRVKQFYLRKAGTNIVLIRTKALAMRDDMIPVSEEKAKALIEAKKAEDQRRAAAKRDGINQREIVQAEAELEQQRLIEAGLASPDETPVGTSEATEEEDKEKGPEDMTIDELKVKAVELKIVVEDEWDEATVREAVTAAMATDEAAEDEQNRKLGQGAE